MCRSLSDVDASERWVGGREGPARGLPPGNERRHHAADFCAGGRTRDSTRIGGLRGRPHWHLSNFFIGDVNRWHYRRYRRLCYDHAIGVAAVLLHLSAVQNGEFLFSTESPIRKSVICERHFRRVVPRRRRVPGTARCTLIWFRMGGSPRAPVVWVVLSGGVVAPGVQWHRDRHPQRDVAAARTAGRVGQRGQRDHFHADCVRGVFGVRAARRGAGAEGSDRRIVDYTGCYMAVDGCSVGVQLVSSDHTSCVVAAARSLSRTSSLAVVAYPI